MKILDKKTQYKLITAIMALSFIELSWVNVSPGLSLLLDVYSASGHGTTAIQMVQAIPSLFMLITVMSSAWFCKRAGSKTVALIGVIMTGLGGTLPSFLYGYYFLIAMSAVKGLGLGLLYSLASGGLIVRSFQGDLRDRLLGCQMTVKNLGGIFMTIAAGYLAASAWNNLFLINLIAVPVFIVAAAFMPSDKVLYEEDCADSADGEKAQDRKPERIHIPFPVLKIGIMIFFWMLVYNVMTPNLAMLITSQKLGDSIEAGYGTSIYTFAGFVSGFIFLPLVKIFGRILLGIGLVTTDAAVIGLSFAGSLFSIYSFIFIGGLGLAAACGAAVREASAQVDGINKIMAVSVISASINLSMFLSPIVMNSLSSAFLGEEPIHRFQMSAIILTPYVAFIFLLQLKAVLKEKKG